MRMYQLVVLLLLITHQSVEAAIDLAKLDRTIAKEPAYQSKEQHYCLLVFGSEAKSRVWLVIDGDTLYVDRNANGDLTDDEPVKLPRFGSGSWHYATQEREARVEAIHDGRLKHANLQLRQMRVRPDFEPQSESEKQLKEAVAGKSEATIYHLILEVEVRPLPGAKIDLRGRVRQSAGVDAEGYLQFARRAKDAPVIHFGGPMHMALLVKHSLPNGEKPGDLMTMVGTPGVGPGTFASVAYNGLISDQAHPVAEIEFPGSPGQPPLKRRAVLKHRC